MSQDTINLIRSLNPVPTELPAPPIDPLLDRLDPTLHTGVVRRRGSRVLRAGIIAPALAVAVTIAVAVTVIVLAGRQQNREIATPPQPSILIPAAARPLTSILEVLRRPQTAADQDPAMIHALRRRGHNKYTLAILGTPVYSLIRRATVTPWGQPIYVIPYLAPTRQARQRLPRKARGATVRTTAALATYPMTGGNGVADMIEGGRDIGNIAEPHGTSWRWNRDRWVMVVPDGVTSVALWRATGSDVNHPHAPIKPGSRPIVVAVHNNIAAFTARGFQSSGQEIWYGPDGEVVKRIANASSCGPPLGDCA
jgi:hypothetical protein